MAAGGGLSRSERKAAERVRRLREEQQRERLRQVSRILRKAAAERSAEEGRLLAESADLVTELQGRSRRREGLKRRLEEVCDDPEELRRKVRELAAAVRNAKFLVVYTGAGISTAASIPDYRGPNGVWTLLQKGRSVRAADLSDAEPTLTHMSIARLHERKLVQHVVSQNCDGLHLRSGLPRTAISELHGNMHIEVCTSCTPNREYVRTFDVTERTALHRHQTGRACHKCGTQLRDTIVHFGERGTLGQPLNWEAATEAASRADTILCLGSSLKVLKKYPRLWCMTKPPSRRPKLYIVNLQWTPKDDWAALKLHGRCDDVMQLLMEELGLEIPLYNRVLEGKSITSFNQRVQEIKDPFTSGPGNSCGRTPSSPWRPPCVQMKKAATAGKRCAEAEKRPRPENGEPPTAQLLSWGAGLAGAVLNVQKGRKQHKPVLTEEQLALCRWLELTRSQCHPEGQAAPPPPPRHLRDLPR